MIVALWLLETVAVVALNVAVVAAAATVTDVGTLSVVFVLLNVTTAPPAGAALVRVTVQVELPEVLKAAGAQDKEATPAAAMLLVTVPFVTETGIALPAGEDTTPLLTATDVLLAPAAMVRLTVATTPFEMMPEFNPEATQLYAPVRAKHANVLPAAVRAAPALTEIEVTLEAG